MADIGFYTDAAAIALEALTEYGTQAAIVKTAQGAYSPDTGTFAATTSTHSVTAIMFPYHDKMIDGTAIIQGDQQVYIAPQGAPDIQPGDVLAMNGADWQVIRCKRLAPIGVDVLFELQVRK